MFNKHCLYLINNMLDLFAKHYNGKFRNYIVNRNLRNSIATERSIYKKYITR